MSKLVLCLAVLLFLILSHHEAHSQECNSYVNITQNSLIGVSGEDVCFRCFFDGMVDPGTLWTIGNPAEAIPPGDGSVVDGVLIIFDIPNVFDQVLTFLTCRAGSDFYQTGVSFAAFVVPTIIGETTLNETDTLSLTCDTSESSPAPSATWLDPSGTEITTVGTLTLENMNRSDAGLYMCVITDLNSGRNRSTNVTVQVQYAPDVNTTVPSPHLSPRGQPLTLSCDYDGVPPPDITWVFGGTTFSESDPRVAIVSTESHSDFTLSDLMEDEAGLYICTASNLLGMSSVEIEVTVQVPPDPPSGLEVVNQTTSNLSLQWTNGGDGQSPITGIVIEYETQGMGVMSKTISEVVEEYTLEGLLPFSTYEIRVYVVNAVGPSDPDTTNGTTDALPLDASDIVSFVAESSTELRLEWQLPSFDAATMSPVVSWKVEYGRGGITNNTLDELGNITSVLIPDLEKGVVYTARVAGRNERRPGEEQLGEFSDTATNQTDVDFPSAPVNLMAYGLTSFSINVTWEPPADNGGRSIINYRIEARVVNGSNGTELFEFIADADVLEYIIRDSFGLVTLEENTTVEVRVSAYNGEEGGIGDNATAEATTLPLSSPQPLLDPPEVVNVTSFSVTITWQLTGSVVDFFVIQYKLRRVGWLHAGVENITVSGMRDIVTINGLMEDSTYDIRIRTKNDLGVSDWSPSATFVTLEEPPLPSPTPIMATVTLEEPPLPSPTSTPEPPDVRDIEGPTGPTPAGDPVTLTCNLGDNVTWSREDDSLPEEAEVEGNTLTIPDPQTEDSGVYVCTAGGSTARFTLTVTPGDDESNGIDELIIIIVAAVGGVSLAVFLIVIVVAVCYFCRKRTPGRKYKVDTKRANMTWIDTAPSNTNFVPSTNPRRNRNQDETPAFDMPDDYQAHSSFNTLEKQRRIRRSPSPGPGNIAYAQLDLARPTTGVRDTTGPVEYSRVSYESASPTSFQYVSDSPVRDYSGLKSWPDNQGPHYSNTVV